MVGRPSVCRPFLGMLVIRLGMALGILIGVISQGIALKNLAGTYLVLSGCLIL